MENKNITNAFEGTILDEIPSNQTLNNRTSLPLIKKLPGSEKLTGYIEKHIYTTYVVSENDFSAALSSDKTINKWFMSQEQITIKTTGNPTLVSIDIDGIASKRDSYLKTIEFVATPKIIDEYNKVFDNISKLNRIEIIALNQMLLSQLELAAFEVPEVHNVEDNDTIQFVIFEADQMLENIAKSVNLPKRKMKWEANRLHQHEFIFLKSLVSSGLITEEDCTDIEHKLSALKTSNKKLEVDGLIQKIQTTFPTSSYARLSEYIISKMYKNL